MALENIQAIGFDMSGTLIDDARGVYATCKVVAEHMKCAIAPTMEEWMRNSNPSGGADVDPVKYRQMFDWYYESLIRDEPGMYPQLLPNVLPTLVTLSHIAPIFIVSAIPQPVLLNLVHHYHLAVVTPRIYSTLNKVNKLREVIATFDLRHDEVAYVGDTTHDIVAAQQVGVMSIAVCSGYHSKTTLEQAHPDMICADVTEVAQRFKKCIYSFTPDI